MRVPGTPIFTANPPFVRGGWDVGNVTLVQLLALLPPLVTMFVVRDVSPALLITALLAVLFWEVLFSLIRLRPLGFHGVTTAIILVIMVPATVPLWQVVLALSLGTVLGELIFGGRGFGFLNAAAASLAFLVFSFNNTVLAEPETSVALATLPGAILLLLAGVISWRIVAATVLVIIANALLLQEGMPTVATGSALIFALTFLICDPIAASVTNGGRWIYGALVGGLILLFNGIATPEISADSLVFAALLGAIFAPLLDYIIVALNIRKRKRRNG